MLCNQLKDTKYFTTATLLRLLQLLNSVETHPAPANKSARPLVDMDLKEEALAVRGITLRTAAEANIMVHSVVYEDLLPSEF